MSANELPILVTFDGEARSGKGTIVQATKDYLRDECGYNVMLIDAGQVFRVLVVAATRAGVDANDPVQIDAFLRDEAEAEKCVEFVKTVYHMEKAERDALLYTNEISANSAKFGARPLCQEFKDSLLKKWLRDARVEGYEVVLLDGRALEEVGGILAKEGLCDFALGLYFTCDSLVAARRTLGFADTAYEDLPHEDKLAVEKLVSEIDARNKSDAERGIHPVIPPRGAVTCRLPSTPEKTSIESRPAMLIFDTSATMTKTQMTEPVEKLVSSVIFSSRPSGSQTTAS